MFEARPGVAALVVLLASSCGSSRDAPATYGVTTTVVVSAVPAPTTLAPTTPTTEAPLTSTSVEQMPTHLIGAPVEWLDSPAHPNQRLFYAHTLTPARTNAPPCPVGVLELVPSADGAMGTAYGGLAVHNLGNVTCEVEGVPFVDLIDDNEWVVQSTDPANGSIEAPPVVLEPNSWAEASLGVVGSNICGGNESSQLRLHWNGEIAMVPFAVGRPPDPESCPATDPVGPGHLQPIGTDGAAFAPLLEPRPADQYGLAIEELVATLDAPAAIRAGSVLHYTIQLAHVTGDSPIILTADTCPIYHAELRASAIDELLNCTESGIVLQRGDAVRFEMELTVSADSPSGSQTLTWSSTEPTGLSATTVIDIVA